VQNPRDGKGQVEMVPIGREEGRGAPGGRADGAFDGDVAGHDFQAARGVVGGCDQAGEEAFADQSWVGGACSGEDGDACCAEKMAREVVAYSTGRGADENPGARHFWGRGMGVPDGVSIGLELGR